MRSISIQSVHPNLSSILDGLNEKYMCQDPDDLDRDLPDVGKICRGYPTSG